MKQRNSISNTFLAINYLILTQNYKSKKIKEKTSNSEMSGGCPNTNKNKRKTQLNHYIDANFDGVLAFL